MKLLIIAVGTKMPDWVKQGCAEYSKRLPKEWQPKLIEHNVAKRSKNCNIDTLKEREADKILADIPDRAHVVALDVLGKRVNTPQLSKSMARWQSLGQTLCLIIGGPDGIAERCLQRANESVSLSNLTLPHPLVRVVLYEQLYRGWTILQNHPYHK